MQAMAFLQFFFAVACSLTQGGASSPIGKVIQMISDLQVKLNSEAAEALKIYEEFVDFCEERSKNLQFEVKTGESEKAELEATISKETANTGALNAKIEELAASIATDDTDLTAATEIRNKQAVDFGAEEKELSEVISMLERAIGILEREMQKGGASMLQLKNAGTVTQALSILVDAAAISAKDGGKLTALLQDNQQTQDGDEDTSVGAPEAAAYEGHSGNIIETLRSLMEKADAQLDEARKKETSAVNNYQMLKQSLLDDIKIATKDLDNAKKGLAKSSETKAVAEGDHVVTTKDLKEDIAALADLHRDCVGKAQDFEAASTSRGEELKALAEAKKVIAESTGGADKIAYGLNQVSLLQVHRSKLASSADVVQFEVVRHIRDLARNQHSRSLAQLAARMTAVMRSSSRAGEDPFAKVTGLITDMISKLEAAAASDATEKAYCDKELSETKAHESEKSTEIEKLSTQIDSMTSRSAKLKEEVAELQKELAELASAQAEMNKLRTQESEAYAKSKPMLEQGLEGIKLALQVLQDYYSHDAANTSGSGAASSIIGLLEVVESDLSKALAELVAAEETAQASYTAETKENEVEKHAKDNDLKFKEKEMVDLEKSAAEATSDRKGVQAELNAVLEYLATLNKRCIAKEESYEERKSRREAELEGLKGALTILEGQAMLLQTKSRRALRGV